MKKFKILSILSLISILTLALSSCGKRKTLLFLNWGEYIDETMIDAFEEKYNCSVSMDLGDSNEIFYSKVRGGTTCYDVVCPSDYMVEKMYLKGMLQEIDFDKLTISGYDARPESDYYKNNIRAGIKSIFNDMDNTLKAELGESYKEGTIQNYCVPYLWGTWGIMYTTKKKGVEEAVTKSSNQWSCLFDRTTLPSGTRVAMYDSYQHLYYAASRYLEKADPLSVNYGTELSNSELGKMETLIEKMKYNAWGTDSIKKDIVAGNIDVGFMWTGDFLYYYCENAANVAMDAYLNGDVTIDGLASMIDTICDSNVRVYEAKSGKKYEIGFDCFIPDDTVAFCDNLVITKDAANKDLAYKFIDFMSSYQTSAYLEDGKEVDIATLEEDDILTPRYTNTYYVDYDACTNDVYDDLLALKDPAMFTDEVKDDFQSASKARGFDAYDSDLYWMFYDYVIGIAFEKYYEKDAAKGSILAVFDRTYINQINATFNNARI